MTLGLELIKISYRSGKFVAIGLLVVYIIIYNDFCLSCDLARSHDQSVISFF